jgi:hypothetical protein
VAALVVVGPAIASASASGGITVKAASTVSAVRGLPPAPTPAPATTPATGAHTASSVKPARQRQFANLPPATNTVPSGVDLDAGVPGTPPPTSIADNCSADVSQPLQTWLNSLAPGTLVRPPAGACYSVDKGITLQFPQGLTIDGGTYKNHTKEKGFAGPGGGRATFNVLGGSHVTFEDLTIKGSDNSGYHKLLAFEAGIQFQGTAGAVIRNTAIDHVFGDGVTLDPLRGSGDHMSGKIIAPTTDVAINAVDIDHSGRQGIGLVSVNSATIQNVALTNVGLDTFDFEADQSNEGAKNVTIDGCTSSTWNGGVFLANAGSSNGNHTENIVVENCQMLHPQGGAAVVITNPSRATGPRGLITFSHDTLWCGASTYVGCFQLGGATVTVTQSIIRFPKAATVHEDLYHAGGASTLSFVGDSVLGWKNLGQGRASSTVSVSGGSWNPSYTAPNVHNRVTVSRANKPHQVHLAAAAAAAAARRSARHPKH